MTEFVVYTAIFGDIRDKLFPPAYTDPNVHYVAFIDGIANPENRNGWECRPARFDDPDPRRRARHHKLLPHFLFPSIAFTLWVDGCLTPKCHPFALSSKYLGDLDVLCTFKHAERTCLYQELEACVRLKKDDPSVMRAQVDRYRKLGYPYHNGLAETTAVLRRNSASMKRFNELWWQELSAGSVRDQLSFDFVAWKLRVRYRHFEGRRYNSPHFHWRPHR